MSKERLSQIDVATIFHAVLFGYQKSLKDVLGDVQASVITWQSIQDIERILESSSPLIVSSENADEALRKFADLLMTSEFVKKAEIRKDGEKYILDIEGCMFAEHIHSMLNPKDVTCPWAITAMAIAQKTSKRKVKISSSEYNPRGTKTPIEFSKL